MSEGKPKTEPGIRLIDQPPLWTQLLRAMVQTIQIVVVIGTGAFLQSNAMQWIGFLILIGRFIVWANAKTLLHMSPQDAADHLATKFGVRAQS